MLDHACIFICKEMCNHIVTRKTCLCNLYARLMIVITLTNVTFNFFAEIETTVAYIKSRHITVQ